MPPGFLPPNFYDTVAMVVVMVSAVIGVTVILRGPIGAALARRLGGHARELPAEVSERLERVADLEERVMELEERLDFSERLLARQPEPPRQARGPADG